MSLLILCVFVFLSDRAHGGEFDYHGYMRAPVGSNTEGGKQYQITNPGSQGNEFRLGNETAYGEAYFTEHFVKKADKLDPFFNANLTFAYAPAMNAQYSDTTVTGDYIEFIEAFAKGGNLDGVPMSFWAGKRFYRDADVHMDDFFYFANMSGDGGGFEDLPLSTGTLALALLQFTDDKTLTHSSVGNPAKHAIDLRWRNIELSKDDQLHVWAALAQTPAGQAKLRSDSSPVSYQQSAGGAVGIRWRHKLFQADNDFAIMYGTGVMESLSLDNTAFAKDDSVSKRRRLRIVENYVAEINSRWAIQAAAVREDADSGLAANSKSDWTSIGVRPMYYFSDHFRIQLEAGCSFVKNESEVNSDGNSVGTRSLTRVTLAPEVAFSKGYYSRPVIRFYVTTSKWNDANGDASNPNSLIGKLNSGGIVSLNDKMAETQTGFEAEVWF